METKEKSKEKKINPIVFGLFLMGFLFIITPWIDSTHLADEFVEIYKFAKFCTGTIIIAIGMCLSSIQNLIEENKQ